MRVTQKIVVGTISINSVQNSSIVQIGSSGMIQSQTESVGNGGGAGNSTGTGAVAISKTPVAPQPPSMPNGTNQGIPSTYIPPTAPCAKPGFSAPGGVTLPPFVYEPTGPLGPVGGIGVTRNKPFENQAQNQRENENQ